MERPALIEIRNGARAAGTFSTAEMAARRTTSSEREAVPCHRYAAPSPGRVHTRA